jgi:hypothetical protein
MKRTLALTLIPLALLTQSAEARPPYAKKENKLCAYCHVDPKGGGPRNHRGTYYEVHNLSFAGFAEQDEKAPKKSGPPAYKKTWQMDLPKESRRIAVGEVHSDKKPRLLVLGSEGELTVFRPAAMALSKESKVDLGSNAAKFVVGKFAKDKPAVIAVPGAVHYLDGTEFKTKKVDLADLTGSVRFTDGAEYIFFFAGGQPDVYGVDLEAANPLTTGREMVMPSEAAGVYGVLVAHMAAEVLGALGVPEEARAAGVVGMIDPRSDGKIYAFWAKQGVDGSVLEILDAKSLGPDNAGGAAPAPVWASPKITGKILDIAPGLDPKTGKTPGFYILHTTGAENQDRAVQFWELD